jgi:hypothetical protein
LWSHNISTTQLALAAKTTHLDHSKFITPFSIPSQLRNGIRRSQPGSGTNFSFETSCMLFLLGRILQSQPMQRLQTGLILLSKVPKARLEQGSQENLQEACCLEPAEGIYTLSWQALG